jgi:hypothetical protein
VLWRNLEAVSSVNALDDGNVDIVVLECGFIGGPNGSDGANMEIIQEFVYFLVCSEEILNKNVIKW